jgi:membrane-associated protein
MESIYELIHQLKELLNPKNIIDFLTTKGLLLTYVGLVLIVFAETGLAVGFFLPGDSLLVVAGLVARIHPDRLNVVILLGTLFVAAVVGDAVGYYTGRAHEFYERYGGKTIIIARFVPVVRTFAPIVAGAAQMSYRQFLAYNVVGGFAWVFSMILAGYFLGTFVERAFGIKLEDHIEWVVIIVVLLSLTPPLYEYLKSRREKKARLRDGDVRV